MSLFQLKPESKRYVESDGPIRYLDPGHIDRPISMPRVQIAIMAAFVLVGAIIAWQLYNNIDDAVFGAAERKQQEIDANLARDIAFDAPVISSLVYLDDNTIRQTFTDAGYAMHEYSDPADYPNGGFESARMPADMNYDEAVALFDRGIASLGAVDASKLLKGMWMYSVDRTEYLDMRVRYVDFASGSLDAAIDAAMMQQGLSADTMLAENGSGVDEVGNTFKAGTLDIDGVIYQWRVSAVPLSDMYGISGLPENAVYVGVRLTA
ncbi:teichoic acid transporter [Adlercreutzia sp. ZJ138]|uniref:teichoic acid transporter n=1 Tax=Adlercreutzia sp. ZJ138 TaxID=2709405 RepID=UPI0013E9A40B|nr:teichoic acid transporter [Adlercreutzia sp. ZJ138]